MTARIHTTANDEAVLREVGAYLGSLQRKDFKWRCSLGKGEKGDKRLGSRERKNRLTPLTSARWANAITRVSEDKWERAMLNLEDLIARDKREIKLIEKKLLLPTADTEEGAKAKKQKRGYATQNERFQKQRRLQKLKARLDDTQARLDAGKVSVCFGSKNLARNRHNLDAANLTEEEWREQWEASRLFLIAHGETTKKWGNETIRVIPGRRYGECEVVIRLPSQLAYLSNTPGPYPHYKLEGTVVWNRGRREDEWRTRALNSQAIAYRITLNPTKGNWLITSSWKPEPFEGFADFSPEGKKCAAVDLNSDHMAARILDGHGNPVGRPKSFAVATEGSSEHRLGVLRESLNDLYLWAVENEAEMATFEKLDFVDIRSAGRQRGRRGKAGKKARAKTCGIPTAKTTAAISSISVKYNIPAVAVEPAYTSRWGAKYWQKPLNQSRRQRGSSHHAAAVPIGRISQGHGVKRKTDRTETDQRADRKVSYGTNQKTGAMIDQRKTGLRTASRKVDLRTTGMSQENGKRRSQAAPPLNGVCENPSAETDSTVNRHTTPFGVPNVEEPSTS